MFQQQYHQEPNAMPIVHQRHRTVNGLMPGIVPGLLGAIQLFLWIAIIALEIMSIYYDAGRGTIYAGLWCSIVFFITWIAMFCYLCCGKSAGCGSYLIIQNTINMIFAIILVVFTSLFLNDPCLCYGVLCFIPSWDYIYDSNFYDNYLHTCTPRTFRKLPILKALLACAVLVLVCNIIFIVIYTILSIRLRINKRTHNQPLNVGYQQRSESVQLEGQSSYHPSTMAYSPYQHSYPIQYTQTSSQWASAPPSYEIRSEKF